MRLNRAATPEEIVVQGGSEVLVEAYEGIKGGGWEEAKESATMKKATMSCQSFQNGNKTNKEKRDMKRRAKSNVDRWESKSETKDGKDWEAIIYSGKTTCGVRPAIGRRPSACSPSMPHPPTSALNTIEAQQCNNNDATIIGWEAACDERIK